MAVYLTPGIYRHARQTERRDVQLVRTDVAGFVGFAERGPLVTEVADPRRAVVRVTSWKEFVTTFGAFIRYSYLSYAVRAFFENGGTTCHVVRVAGTSPASSTAQRLGAPRRATFAMPWRERALLTPASEVLQGASSLALADATQVGPGDLLRITQVLPADPKMIKADEFVMVVEGEGNTVHFGTRLRLEHDTEAHDTKAELRVFDPAFQITATSAGNWGNRLSVAITPLEPGPDVREFALRVRVERRRGYPGEACEEEFFNHLSLDKGSPDKPNPYFAPLHVNTVSNLLHIEVTENLGGKPPNLLLDSDGSLVCGKFSLQGGQDGLAGLETRDVTGGTDDLRGIRLLEEIDEVAILCAPDAVFELPEPSPPVAEVPDPCAAKKEEPAGDDVLVEDETAQPPAQDTVEIYRAMVDQCERRRDRVAILDVPALIHGAGPLKAWRDSFFTRFAALYHPWLVVPDEAAIEGPTRRVPPSGHVAGIYARIDNSFGVHWPPANAPLDFVNDVVEEISVLEQQNLNPYGINAIRSFHGRGIRLWGARSLAGKSDSDWRFIHVRRLMSMIEESVDKSMQWAVFEPNNEALRRTLVHSLSVFLEVIWRQGGLKGDRPDQGFYVKCDEANNPTAIVDAGQVVCEVGVAIAAPMEFLVFEIRQMPGAAELVER
jgi:phage tail sheath protein FI